MQGRNPEDIKNEIDQLYADIERLQYEIQKKHHKAKILEEQMKYNFPLKPWDF